MSALHHCGRGSLHRPHHWGAAEHCDGSPATLAQQARALANPAVSPDLAQLRQLVDAYQAARDKLPVLGTRDERHAPSNALPLHRESLAWYQLREALDRLAPPTSRQPTDPGPPPTEWTCANCGQPIRRTVSDDGYDRDEVLWTHSEGGMYCDLDTPRASPGGDGWG